MPPLYIALTMLALGGMALAVALELRRSRRERRQWRKTCSRLAQEAL